MRGLRTKAYRAGLDTLYFSGAHRALKPLFGGIGAILTLHHVRPARRGAFQPNALLEVTPDFLDAVLHRLRDGGFDLVSLDEAVDRIAAGGSQRPFVALTFDDGYRDNVEFAYPVLKKHEAPFAVYVATSFAEHSGELWWLVLERTIDTQRAVTAQINGRVVHFDCSDAARKWEAFHEIYWWLRSLPETELRAYVRDLAARHGLDFRDSCRSQCLDWEEIEALARDPAVTIGAHTVNHVMLAKYPAETVRDEMVRSRSILEARIGRPIHHFAYPVGDPTSAGPREFALAAELGFRSAVTTRPGLIFAAHGRHLTALPRVSLNGHFQALRYLDVLLSGAPFALFNRFRRVNAA